MFKVATLFVLFNLMSGQLWGEEPALSSNEGIGPDREWAQRTSKINVQNQRIKDSTDKLKNLILASKEGRQMLDEKNNPIEVLPTISATHKKLKTEVEEYNKIKEELKYRYPEEGVWIERRYLPMRLQTLEEIENDIGIEGRMDRLKHKSDKKYETFIGRQPVKAQHATPLPQSTLQNTESSQKKEESKNKLKLVR